MAVSANITMMCASAGGQSIACLLDHSSEYLHSAVSSVSVELIILRISGMQDPQLVPALMAAPTAAGFCAPLSIVC